MKTVAGWLLLTVLCAAPQVHAEYYNQGDTLICESHDRRQNWCEADTRYGVVLVNQLSRTSCIEGQNWGQGARGVWVSGGCRAEFEVGSPPRRGGNFRPGPGGQRGRSEVIVCESISGRRAFCPARIRHGAELLEQLSDSDCVEDETWGYDRSGIWVSRGCRGEFRAD